MSGFVYEESNSSTLATAKYARAANSERAIVAAASTGAKSGGATSAYAFFRNVFLPANFPDSVSADYLAYQFWDTVQAFASSISGSLATQVS